MSAGGGSVTPEPSDGPTSSACLEELLACGVAAVRQAAAFALNPGEELRVEAKAHRNDLVTQVDRGVEERIAGHLEATGVPIHGEEAHRVEDFETYRGRAWVLDPIDGTLNYVATHRDWAISLALVDDGAPTVAVLADPVADRLYTAIRGRGAWVQP
ncbi:inositol monophosphatase family protein, partial [Actinomyces oris]|uniref:inositol monophosphatase family protein n=2 Tax=Actinomycetaceae TaxID=2049 RepID=UPI001146FDA0